MKSMTGYGVATGRVGRGRLYVELKTINHRYCDVSLRIPPRMSALEGRLREKLQNVLKRGKVELFFREVEPIFGGAELVINVDLAKQYQKALKRLQRSLQVTSQADLLSLVGMNPFIQSKEKEGNYTSYWSSIRNLMSKVIDQVEKMRRREGAHLLKDQKKRLKELQSHLRQIGVRSHKNSKRRRATYVVSPGNGNGGNQILTDKMDITEELIRLKSHADQYGGLLNAKGPAGRKLDFLIQEMHREINTVGAKGADARISRSVVDCKALLENLREQVQNIV